MNVEDEAKFIAFSRSAMWIGKEWVFIDKRETQLATQILMSFENQNRQSEFFSESMLNGSGPTQFVGRPWARVRFFDVSVPYNGESPEVVVSSGLS